MTLNFEKNNDDASLRVRMEGSIDTVTAPALEEGLRNHWEGVTTLTLDFTQVDYISSAGLRVLMIAFRQMEGIGKLVLEHVNEEVLEVLEMTGLNTLLNIE